MIYCHIGSIPAPGTKTASPFSLPLDAHGIRQPSVGVAPAGGLSLRSKVSALVSRGFDEAVHAQADRQLRSRLKLDQGFENLGVHAFGWFICADILAA